MSHEEKAREIMGERSGNNNFHRYQEELVTKITKALKDEEAKWEKRVAVLVDSADNLYQWMSANIPEMECRGDEDCDHCLGIQVLKAYRAMEKGNDENAE